MLGPTVLDSDCLADTRTGAAVLATKDQDPRMPVDLEDDLEDDPTVSLCSVHWCR